jgi:hypothetical protein
MPQSPPRRAGSIKPTASDEPEELHVVALLKAEGVLLTPEFEWLRRDRREQLRPA